MNAKGGKGIEVTTHNHPRRVFLQEDGRIVYEDGTPADSPEAPGYARVQHAGYANLPPPPSALDSIWQAIWKFLKENW